MGVRLMGAPQNLSARGGMLLLALLAICTWAYAPAEASAAVDAKVNFQPAGAPVPSGYSADTGAPYSATAGQGWVREDSLTSATHVPLDVSANARDRNIESDQRLDTMIHMQYPPTTPPPPPSAVVIPAAWELALPAGGYTVTVGVGDASANFDSSHRINIEGQNAIAGFTPTAADRFRSATATVNVSDGRLTIDAKGGANTKIDYVTVTSTSVDTTPPAAPTNVRATAGNGRVDLAWNANTEIDLAGYDVYRATSLPVPTTGPSLNATTLSANSFADTSAVNATTYYYVVVAKDTSGNRAAAAAVSATPQAPLSVDRKVNFQPAGAPVPSGYSADTGAPYSATAGQGWVREDSLTSATHVPLDVSANARDRNIESDQRLDTMIHMQYPPTTPPPPPSAVVIPAAWELALPAGGYTVTVGVGDASANFDSSHRINIEGQNAIAGFTPSSGDRFATTTRTVNVSDGRLTIDALGGANTKIDYVTIVNDTADRRPSVTSVRPGDGATNVLRDAPVTAEVRLPNLGDGIDATTLNASTVRLLRNSDGVAVPANRNTTGGGDAIIVQPTAPLDPSTRYRFEVTSGLKDLSGAGFLPFDSTFTTGTQTGGGGGGGAVQFEQVPLSSAQGQSFTSVAIGPDNRLYAGTYDGSIYRFPIAADGTTGSPQIISSLRTANGGSRTILGLAFDPAATASNPILWVSNNEATFSNATDWSGKISRLSGSDLQTVQDYVVGLPRSIRDHETNSLAFGPDGALYVTQGSNSSNGAPDTGWGLREEHVLTAAVLRIDTTAITSAPLNVKTEEGGTYDPFASSAPVTVYASGLRNAFDLVWHSNGQLYVPTNGAAAGGNAPASPATLPASCQKRLDSATRGNYTGPSVPGLTALDTAQDDYLFRVQKGGYYGHPNPKRCEWVLNGGNPTSGSDSGEVSQYPIGVAPDRNWRGASFDFGQHFSPDGAIEYRSNTFGGALQGKLLVVRYSAGDDIIVLSPGTSNPDIQSSQTNVPGLTGFVDPLDLIEDRRNGNLYVTELGASRITLLRPVQSTGSPTIATSPSRMIFNDVVGGSASASKSVTVSNTGTAPLSVSSLGIGGANPSQFRLASPPALPASIPAGGSLQLQVVFDPTASAGPKRATLTVASNDSANPQKTIDLRGLGTAGLGGTNEPSLQWILDTYDIPVNVGDPDPTTSALPSTPRIGEEVDLQRMVKGPSGNVTIEPLGVFGPQSSSGEVTNLGWTPVGGGTRTKLFSVANAAYQSLDPQVSGNVSFDPGSGSFAMSTIWPFFSNREISTDDTRNTFAGALPHQVRAYPLKAADGSVVADSYVVAFEEDTGGYDFQDLVFIVRNVRPAPTSAGGRIGVTNLDGVPFADRLAFNRIGSLASPPATSVHDRATVRISNTGSGPLRISGLSNTGPFSLVSPPALPATIASGGQLDLTVRFIAESGGAASGSLTISSDDSATPSRVVQLAGFWQPVPEGGAEPTLANIVNDVFGYKTDITYPGQTLNRAGRIETAGEEVLSPYWSRVDTSKPVSVRQLTAFHTQGNTATLLWHARGSSTTNTVLTHSGADGQSLLPRLNGSTTAPAAGTFSPTGSFGLKIDTEWSDDSINDQNADRSNGCPGPCGHHIRIWPARDRAGTRIADSWLVAMDYSGINYDYNDNVYLVSNMKPEGTGPLLHRLDVGGSSNYTDSLNQVWKPDTGLFSPSTAPAEGAGVTPLQIENTVDDPIYQTYRGNVGNVPLDQRSLSYALPTGGATRVDLRLYFAERSGGNNAPGRRVFDISAEGQLLVDNFDIYSRTGALNRAYELALNNVAVSDGTLNLVFKPEADYASIAGIEVFCRSGTGC